MLAGLVCYRAKDFMLTAVRHIPSDPRQNLWQAWEAAEIVSTGGPCEKTLGYMETEQVMGCLLVYIERHVQPFSGVGGCLWLCLLYFSDLFLQQLQLEISREDSLVSGLPWSRRMHIWWRHAQRWSSTPIEIMRLGLQQEDEADGFKTRLQWLGFSGSKS